jgi:hypothetical protein
MTAAAVGVALLGVAPAPGAKAAPVPDEGTVDISCQEVDGIFLVDWATLRAKVPERYPLMVVNGKGQIAVATKHCHSESPEGLFSPVDTQEVIILPYLAPIQPVPPGTVQGFDLYLLANYKATLDGSKQTLNDFLHLSRKIGQPAIDPKAMSVTITSTSGSGELVERGSGNGAKGFRWSETHAPPGAAFVQVNRFFFAHPNGSQTITEAPQNIVLGGTGSMTIEADPKSVLGDFGPVLTGGSIYMESMTSLFHIFREPR